MKITDLLCAPPEPRDDLESASTSTDCNIAKGELKYLLYDDTEPQKTDTRGNIQFLLCDTNDNQKEEQHISAQRHHQVPKTKPTKKSKRTKQPATTAFPTLSVIPDEERKRTYRLSTKQHQRRLDNEVLNSQVYNLTLNVNNLKQEIRYLQESHDLYVTRMNFARHMTKVRQLIWYSASFEYFALRFAVKMS